MQWVEEISIINEAQAGFRRNYSTVDHIFYIICISAETATEPAVV